MAEIPLAVAPSVRTPGVAVLVDLKAGTPSPGTGARRALVLAHKSASGTITADTDLRQGISGEAEAAILYGEGTPGYLACLRLFEEYGVASVDVVSPAAPGGGVAATSTITFASSPTSARLVHVDIGGRVIEFTWAAGETAIQAATRLVGLINAYGKKMPVTADNGSGTLAVVTMTFRVTGAIGNDLRHVAYLSGGAGGTVSPDNTSTAFTSGSGNIDLANVLALVVGREYAAIVPCISSVEASDASGTATPADIKAHIGLYGSGFNARLQQAIFATNASSNSAAKVGTAAINFERHELLWAKNARSLPCEIAGAEAGARLRDESIDPAVNRIGQTYRAGLLGPYNVSTGRPSDAEVEDSLQYGVTPCGFNDDGTLFVIRPITTYHKTGAGAADDRVLDVTRVSGIDAVVTDLRSFLPAEFPGAKLIPNPADAEEIPDGTVPIGDIEMAVAGRVETWIRRGVIERARWDVSVANGEYICRINPSDGSQVDLVVPMRVVRPLAKFSLVGQGI